MPLDCPSVSAFGVPFGVNFAAWSAGGRIVHPISAPKVAGGRIVHPISASNVAGGRIVHPISAPRVAGGRIVHPISAPRVADVLLNCVVKLFSEGAGGCFEINPLRLFNP